ncbi:MAG: hypothetical protein L6Q59_02270 [Ignavibacteriaceae bacterium]|nr:hypothetical protein [Ignavibacteriaceae bacterium]
MKKTGSTVTPPDFSGLSVHLCCNEQSATGGQAGNVGRVKTNGKRGSAVVLLYEGSAYMRFCDFSWDASIASLTDTAADQVAFVMLKTLL